MPIYEYSCNNCGEKFEELVFAGKEPEKCPKCNSLNVIRMISTFSSANSNSFDAAPNSGCMKGRFS